MGNYASCVLSGPNTRHNKSAPTAVKVIFPGGEIRSFDEVITAAELMLETPNSFLIDCRSLHMSRRFSPLSADEELEMGGVYVLFPKQRLNSVVNTADMGALFLAAKRGSTFSTKDHDKHENDTYSSQQGCSQESVSKLNLDDVDGFLLAEAQHRLSKCRSKKPLLETIVEWD